MKLEDIRREYLKGALDESMLKSDPMVQFEVWMSQAIHAKLLDPTAMTLATVNSKGQPSQRIVLLKHVDARGFVFFSNYESSKAKDMESNPYVSLHFPWHVMERQVHVRGHVEKVSVGESRDYFSSRPRDSQIAAWASAQSREIASREALQKEVTKISEKYSGQEIPLPPFWGGYRVSPQYIEFWQGGAGRLHDRVEYLLDDQEFEPGKLRSAWSFRRLAP